MHPPDIAVVLKGPLERIVLREKQRVAGVWMNVERARFRSAPLSGCSRAVCSSLHGGRPRDLRCDAQSNLSRHAGCREMLLWASHVSSRWRPP